MRTLVYKRTHPGDPNLRGHFGNEDCMGRVRAWDFEAVIGVGGIGGESSSHALDGKVNWIGIGPHKHPRQRGRGPIVSFDRFVLFEERGPDFAALAPRLARRLFDKNVRVLLHDVSAAEQEETDRVLKLASRAKPSRAVTSAVVREYGQPRHRSGCGCRTCSSRSATSGRARGC